MYSATFPVEIVIHGVSSGSLKKITGLQTISYVTMSNVTELFSHVSEGFAKKKKVLVIFRNTESILIHRHLMDQYSSTLGLSRWVLSVNTTYSESLVPKLPIFFLCLTILLENDSMDVPANFVNCDIRNRVSAISKKGIESFRLDNFATICVSNCVIEDIDNYMRMVTKFLNISTWSIDALPSVPLVNSKDETFRLLNERRSMICLERYAFNPERFMAVPISYPHAFGGYQFVAWRQRFDTFGSAGLVQIFDSWLWLSLSLVAVAQLLFTASMFSQEVSYALVSVASCFLSQPLTLGGHSKAWVINIFCLEIGCLFLCLLFKNQLTSCLNISIWYVLDNFEDLRYLFQYDMITHVCIPTVNYLNDLIDPLSEDVDFSYLGQKKSLQRVIKRDGSSGCFSFVRESKKHTALLYSTGISLDTISDRANLSVGATSKNFVMAGFPHAPWLPFEHDFRRLTLQLLATDIPLVTNYSAFIKQRRQGFGPPQDALQPVSLEHLDIAFLPLGIGLIAGVVANLRTLKTKLYRRRFVE